MVLNVCCAFGGGIPRFSQSSCFRMNFPRKTKDDSAVWASEASIAGCVTTPEYRLASRATFAH